MEQSIKDIFEISASIAGVVIPLMCYAHEHFKRNNDVYLKERYENVIYPIYSLIEPYLFNKKIDEKLENVLKQCQLIVEKNKMISGYKIVSFFNDKINTIHKFKKFGAYIENQFDRHCRLLGIPQRPLDYKLSKSYTPSKIIQYILIQFLYLILSIIFLVSCSYLLTLMKNLIY